MFYLSKVEHREARGEKYSAGEIYWRKLLDDYMELTDIDGDGVGDRRLYV
ncbi:MAG: hypothetical protein FGF52_00525 [Candidatus Brockarchaeota archaeon]|nr:hypothetical protein [Candidatus Brockarchaeota archaeon]